MTPPGSSVQPLELELLEPDDGDQVAELQVLEPGDRAPGAGALEELELQLATAGAELAPWEPADAVQWFAERAEHFPGAAAYLLGLPYEPEQLSVSLHKMPYRARTLFFQAAGALELPAPMLRDSPAQLAELAAGRSELSTPEYAAFDALARRTAAATAGLPAPLVAPDEKPKPGPKEKVRAFAALGVGALLLSRMAARG